MKLISAFVFATLIVQSLFYLNPKSQDSSHLLWLYSPVCVRPGRKPRRPVFSQRGSYVCGIVSDKPSKIAAKTLARNFCLFVWVDALRPRSTAEVMSGRWQGIWIITVNRGICKYCCTHPQLRVSVFCICYKQRQADQCI